MYRSFFGLKQLPFKISPDLNFFYKQASRADIAQALLYSIERGDGIIKVVGEVGIGKTTLLRLLIEQLPDNYQKIYASSPNLKPIDFLRFICRELGVVDHEQDTKLDLIKKLNHYLIDVYAQNQRVVMLIDEAQAMTLDTLEEVRLLGNLETGEDKLLQIILCGQPELETNLEDIRVRPLKDRIANSILVPSLTKDEVYHYLNYRMRVAGHMEGEVFPKKIADRVQVLSKGLPRSINLIADKLLMAAFSDGSLQVQTKHFALIGYDANQSKMTQYMVYWVLVLLSGSLLLAVGWLMLTEHSDPNGQVALSHKAFSVEEDYSLTLFSPELRKQLLAENLRARNRLSRLNPEQEIWVLKMGGLTAYQQAYGLLSIHLTEKAMAQVYTLVKLDSAQPKGVFVLWTPELSEELSVFLASEQGKSLKEGLKITRLKGFADIIRY